MDPPGDRDVRVGEVHLSLRGRELEIEGLPERFRIAALRGTAPFAPPAAIEVPSEVQLVLAIGSLGDSEEAATATLAALGALGRPVLVLAGGRDDPDLLHEAIGELEAEAADRVIDVSALRRIRIGAVVLVPVAGAPRGRYARADAACGIGQDDLDAIADELGSAEGERRLLLSWAAPSGSAASLGIEGADGGSSEIAALAAAIGASGGIHAWPEAQAGRTLEGHAIVAPIAGPAALRADGSSGRGPLVLELGPEGLRPP
jgi:hypothetical protein